MTDWDAYLNAPHIPAATTHYVGRMPFRSKTFVMHYRRVRKGPGKGRVRAWKTFCQKRQRGLPL